MALPAPITSRSNASVKALRSAFSGNARKPGDLVGIEGEHLIGEALRSGLVIDTVFLRHRSEQLLERIALQMQTISVLAPDVFDSAVETASPQGIAATLAIPDLPIPANPGLLLVLESLQDPGNLGTLIRSAEAFGVSAVWLSPDTVSPWNPKVIRASAGSVFRMPTLRAHLSEVRLRFPGLHLHAAVASSPMAIAPAQANFTSRCAMMVGNEGAGLSPSAVAMADTCITIPCSVESLNAAVAGSVLLYEAQRQRRALVTTP